MKMRRFLFNKLARDKSIAKLEKQGAICKVKNLEDNSDYLEALTQKIVEELEEVFECGSQEELLIELADLEEVLDCFKKLVKIDQKAIDDMRKAKIAERGNYDGRMYVEYTDIPESATQEIEYFSSQPDRYPEVDPKTGEFIETDEDEE